MNKNVYLKLRHPGNTGEINVSSLRKVLGYLNAKRGGDFLSYKMFSLSTEKELRTNFPSIIYGGNHDFAVIKAYGKFASDVLLDSVELIVALLNDHYEIEIESEVGEFEMHSNESESKEYYIRSLVIQDVDDRIPREVIESLKNNEQNDYIIRKIQFYIVKSIKEQSKAMRVGTNFLNVSDISFNSSVPVKSIDEVYQLAVKDVRFSVNSDLSPNWYAGLLRSRGFGEIELMGGEA
jgi:hypothetical protein